MFREALTFDDVLLVPGYSGILPSQVDVSTRLARGIVLNIPLVSAAMDTATKAELARAVAREVLVSKIFLQRIKPNRYPL